MDVQVTFLFTDLEESTRQWERHADAMRDALLRHDAIMQAAIDEHDGELVKHTGDGVCAAFPDASRAAAACLAAQRALQSERFDRVALRARMAIYTGLAERQGSDYRGPVLNRAARLMAAAHGGQVLVSQSARAQIGDCLPDGVQLRDMGLRRLKDVSEPEQVFQLVAEGLPADFPPLRTLDVRKLAVPASTTEFIGRERDLDAIDHALRGNVTRLLTLTGPGGTGKSRLAVETARRLVDAYDEGVVFVPLAAVVKAEMVVPAIAKALDVREAAGVDLVQTLCEALRDKSMLVILDNFEQVMAAAPVVSMLLEGAPRLRVLITSREPLRLSGEREHAVAPLALPNTQQLPELGALAQVEAVMLFMARAQAVKSDLRLVPTNAGDVAYICCRLDGLPLAIELAAARVRILPLQRIRGELDERLRFLTGGARNEPERHRTLRATIDWSYDLLTDPEQALFRQLAVFRDGATMDGVASVCRPGGDEDTVVLLESLVAKNLVRCTERNGEPRFSMLETISDYARERFDASAEAPHNAAAHAEFFTALAERAAPQLNDARQAEWLRRLDAEDENLRAALAHCAGGAGIDRGLRLCKALHRFWTLHGRLNEGRKWCGAMLDASEGAPPSLARAATVNALAVLALHQDDYDVARPLLVECAASLRAMGKVQAAGRVLNNLGVVLVHLGELGEARRTYEESLAIKRETGDPLISMTVGNLANVLLAEGRLAEAQSMLAGALEDDRRHGSPENLAGTLCKIARAARKAGEFDHARSACDESISILRGLNAAGPLAEVLEERGNLAVEEASLDQARGFYTEALTLAGDAGARAIVAAALEGLGTIAAARGSPFAVARDFAAASRIRREISAAPALIDSARRDGALASARAILGDARFQEAWSIGANASLSDALDFAVRPDPFT